MFDTIYLVNDENGNLIQMFRNYADAQAWIDANGNPSYTIDQDSYC